MKKSTPRKAKPIFVERLTASGKSWAKEGAARSFTSACDILIPLSRRGGTYRIRVSRTQKVLATRTYDVAA